MTDAETTPDASAGGFPAIVVSADDGGPLDATLGGAGNTGGADGAGGSRGSTPAARAAYKARAARRAAAEAESAVAQERSQRMALEARLAALESASEAQTSAETLLQTARETQRKLTDAQRVEAQAERDYAAAQEEGDPTRIAAAQRMLTEAVLARREREAEFRTHADQHSAASSPDAIRRAKEDAQRRADSEARRQAWMRDNPWYGKENDMTAAAREADARIRQERRIAVGSDDYWREIEEHVERAFPDRFEGGDMSTGRGTTPPLAGSAGAAATSAVRPRGGERGRDAAEVRLSRDELAAARAMKLTPEEYARGKLDAMQRGELD